MHMQSSFPFLFSRSELIGLGNLFVFWSSTTVQQYNPLGTTAFPPRNHVNSQYKCHKLCHPYMHIYTIPQHYNVTWKRVYLCNTYIGWKQFLMPLKSSNPFKFLSVHSLMNISLKKCSMHRQNRSTDLPDCQICLLAFCWQPNPCWTSAHWCSQSYHWYRASFHRSDKPFAWGNNAICLPPKLQ